MGLYEQFVWGAVRNGGVCMRSSLGCKGTQASFPQNDFPGENEFPREILGGLFGVQRELRLHFLRMNFLGK